MDTYLCSINWGYVIAIATIIFSFIPSFANLIYTKKTAEKTRLTNIITSSRIEWIDKLKNHISSYIKKVYFFYDREISENPSLFMEELYEKTAQIKLHTNFNGKADKQIANQLDEINQAFEEFFAYKSISTEQIGDDGKRENILKIIEKFQFQYPTLFNNLYKKEIKGLNISSRDNWNSIKNKIEEKYKTAEKINEFLNTLWTIINKQMKINVNILKYSHKKLLIFSQIYLKTEWERVKSETQSGNSLDFDFDSCYFRLLKLKKAEIDKINKQIKNINL